MDKPTEKVVEVEVAIARDGNKASLESPNRIMVKRFVIKDTDPLVSAVAHYRTDNPLKAYNAWTHYASGARWFMTSEHAQVALKAMWQERIEVKQEAESEQAER